MSDNGTDRCSEERHRLSTLPEDLLGRLDVVKRGPAEAAVLLEAVMSVGRGLDLPQVLRRIVEAAVVVVDAEYGALGVVGEGTRLTQFLPVGMTREQHKAIGPLPEGHGILGELIRHPVPLRLAELSEHPSSYGFPPNHPPMHSFLGVPIRVCDEVFGNLYLTEKRGGRTFDAEDETVLSALAVAAGVAIENARVYAQTRDRRRWQEANSQVVASLLSGADDAHVLRLIVDHSARILGADLGVLALPAGGLSLRVALASGRDAEMHRGLILPREGSLAGAALDAGEPITSLDVADDPRITAGPPRWTGLGPAVAVPMVTGERTRGVLALARARGRPAFTDSDTAPLLAFAGQAALAMELTERRESAEQIALLEERDRIARDLHDLAIQRLFATGMTLQSAVRLVEQPQASERLLRAVDDLDETIKIIRSAIFGLRARGSGRAGQGLRSRTVTTVEQAVRTLGFQPSLRMEGLIDTDVPAEIAEQMIAVLGEALSNVARHARATGVSVSLVVGEGALNLVVSDNGVGMPEHGASRSGLDNLARRAEKLGGAMSLEASGQGGTRLSWRVPLRIS
ncbi:GAF domain-containing protein [Streptomyces sp. JV185]|uniref:GAF domain-containing sensor histidine kinase n=1 Tax=Streptomyces sp. JV185 TaxID=858638 RepID=UPI002E790437|nr:GAF domain-containing protein [Streptomyces sp. JV185]MEE1769110.1 GAF domain-containing protein [Streptomyces sp. JV185]